MTQSVVPPQDFAWSDLDRAASSLALRAGSQVYIAGVSAPADDILADASTATGGLAEQSRVAYKKIGAALDAAGKSIADVVKVVEYVRESACEQYDDASGVRDEVFAGHKPAVNTVIVKQLAEPAALIAIEVTAGPTTPVRMPGAWLPTASESEGVIYLPNVLARDERGAIIAPGDIVGQTRAIFEQTAKTLSALGLGMDKVVMTVDHLTLRGRSDYKHSAPIRQDFLGPVFPGAAGIVMPRLAHPDAVIQYAFTATRDTPVKIDPGWSRYSALTYSAAVRAGKFLFMSGQGARDPVSGIMQAPDDVLAQSEYIYGKITKVIEAAGGTANNIVSLVEYVAPRSFERYAAGIGDVRRRVFQAPYPTATGFACESLLRKDMEIEVVPFAVMDWQRQ